MSLYFRAVQTSLPSPRKIFKCEWECLFIIKVILTSQCTFGPLLADSGASFHCAPLPTRMSPTCVSGQGSWQRGNGDGEANRRHYLEPCAQKVYVAV